MNIHFPPFIYMFFLISGTLLTISSSSWFGMWLGLEINMMAFIPMIINLEENKKSTEAAIKYFLIQAMASAIFIMSTLIDNLPPISYGFPTPNILITLALGTKLGFAPFHFWFPEVMEGLNWINNIILVTWQKISPLIVLSLFFNYNTLFFLASISALTGAISGINQTSMRKILAYSSISHLGWIASMMFTNNNLWTDYFIIYCMTSFIVCLSFWMFNLNYIAQLLAIENLKKKIIIFMNLLSLGGLPPLLGFFPKWIAMYLLKDNIPILSILIFSSLITLFFYTRLCFSTFTLSLQDKLWMVKLIDKKVPITLSLLTIFSFIGIVPLALFSF
nr:NADH dehydrogenase subunit 2 [Capitulum mitella]